MNAVMRAVGGALPNPSPVYCLGIWVVRSVVADPEKEGVRRRNCTALPDPVRVGSLFD